MTDVKKVKKELLKDCGDFLAILERKPKKNEPLKVLDVFSLNKNILRNLQEVLKTGNEADKKESMTAFCRVLNTFQDVSTKAAATMGNPKMSHILADRIKGKEIFTPEQLKAFEQIRQDLRKSDKKTSKA